LFDNNEMNIFGENEKQQQIEVTSLWKRYQHLHARFGNRNGCNKHKPKCQFRSKW